METLELVVRSAGGLLAVLGTVWLLTRVARARGGAGTPTGHRLRVVTRASVGRRASVVSVDAGDRVLVLGVTDGAVRLLAEQPALPVTDDPAAPVERSTVAPGVVEPGAAVVPSPRSPVAGSLLDAATWRSVVQVARDRTVRR
ncbi:FliO/MopB family protein [Aquipuribacter nitratireducens]|uniref:FliO/MopB family protein n=1 Tax=Aquipuribacter nitratireducens TaxID=650104 RepID=A0ABW0GPT9_9MICO